MIYILCSVLLLVLSAVVEAGSPVVPIVITDGAFTSDPVVVAAIGANAALGITPTGLNFPDQVLTYRWQDSPNNGLTWNNWTGGVLPGGPLLDRQGRPMTTVYSIGPPKAHGPQRLRLTGYLTNPGHPAVTLNIAVGDAP